MLRYLILFLLPGLFLMNACSAQEDPFDYIRSGVKSGSSEKLAVYFHKYVELNLEGEKAIYSSALATKHLANFFKKNPPTKFDYVHDGSSREGLMYAIGSYRSSLNTYRVLIRVKQSGDNFEIYFLEFIKQ